MESTTPPIAIVGMACRFSGGVDSPEKLWKMCAEGRSGWSKIPASRFNAEGAYQKYSSKTGTMNVVGGHFLDEDPAVFDANFFGLSHDTAANMDPQFRMQLETTYEAFEDAGLTLQDVAGSNTSVYAGAFFRDYGDGLIRDPDVLPRYYLLGIGGAMAANRLSHFYDLRGPSMTIDTGCSTSLTALHQACQSLRAGESTMSIVSGANVILNPDMFAVMSSLQLLSPDGKSYAFDSRANGYGRGEGSATVLLKRLDDALRDGDAIRAVIRETGVNQDGYTETITSPSPRAQQQLMEDCYRRAGLEPAQTTYIEAHGTGTPTGDPVEAKAIAATFRRQQTDGMPSQAQQPPLFLGSVKTNIGHTETASGLASVIRAALCLEKRQIPPHLNFEQANQELKLDDMSMKVPTELIPWPDSGGIRRASVNSFGYGGTNAHAIMEDYASFVNGSSSPGPELEKLVKGESRPRQPKRARVINLSGKDERATEAMMEDLKGYLITATASTAREDQEEGRLLDDVAYTLGRGRTRFSFSASLQATSVSELVSGLDSKSTKPLKSFEAPRLGFVFTGQGAQWPEMGRDVVESYPAYKTSLVDSTRILKELGASWDLMDELKREAATSRVNEAFLSMPASVATQVALVDLLRSWGVNCAAVVSHSSGEIAAAYAAGALTKRGALVLAYSRGRFSASGQGAMMAVALDQAEAQAYIDNERVVSSSGRLVVACMNGPTSTTVSGDIPALEALEEVLVAENIFHRRLRVDNAYHSFQMEKLRVPYEEWIASHIVDRPSSSNTDRPSDSDELGIVFCSPVNGGRIKSRGILRDPAHWGKGMISPVRFLEAFQEFCRPDVKPSSPASAQNGDRSSGIDMVIEVGPHGALAGPIREILSLPEFTDFDTTPPYETCLIRGQDGTHTLHKLVCSLLDHGYPVDLGAVNFPSGRSSTARVLHDLPHYPWNHRTRYWSEPRINKSLKDRPIGYHDLLGWPTPGANAKTPSWRNAINQSDIPWVRDHVVQSNVVYPGAGLIVMAVEAALQSCQRGILHVTGFALRNIDLLQALIVPVHPASSEVQIELRPRSESTAHNSGWKMFTIHSIDHDNAWTTICKGLICVHFLVQDDSFQPASERRGPVATQLPPASTSAPEMYRVCLSPQQFYANVRAGGISHGPSFQNMQSIRARRLQSLSTFRVADTAGVMPHQHQHQHVIHPTTLDSIIQSAYPALKLTRSPMKQALVPRSIQSMWISSAITQSAAGASLRSYARSIGESGQRTKLSVMVYPDDTLMGNDVHGTNTAVVTMDGIVLQALGATASQTAAAAQQDINGNYSVSRWIPDFSLISKASWDRQLSCSVSAEERDFIVDLNKVCRFFLRSAVESLSPDDVRGLAGHQKKYYTWMGHEIERAQRSRPLLAQQNPNSEDEGVVAKVSKANVVGEVVCKLGPSIPALLRNQITPLELLMNNALLERYYAESARLCRSYYQLGRLVESYCHKNPRARVLEIGAGTGAATMTVLTALDGASNSNKTNQAPMAASYDYTDISVGFLDGARAKFAAWGELLRYRVLDIERDPSEQGFEPVYDLVIASQVLHATQSVRSTMANVRRLMKPGGQLFMIETTQDQIDIHFVFGLLPEWWSGEEKERATTPSFSVRSWDAALRDTGFGGVDVEVHDCQDETTYSLSVMSSTALELKEREHTANQAVIVVNGVISETFTGWIDSLRALVLDKTGHLPPIQRLASLDVDGKACIYVGDLENAAVLRDPNMAALESIKSMCLRSTSVLWITRGGAFWCERVEQALSSGFLRTIRAELAGRRLISFDLDPAREAWSPDDMIPLAKATKLFHVSARTKGHEDYEYAERHGVIYTLRYTTAGVGNQRTVPEATETPFRALVATPGLLNTLCFVEDSEQPLNAALPRDMLRLEPKAFGLNFRDIMVAMGQLPGEIAMGFECAGVVVQVGAEASARGGFQPGDRVMALTKGHIASMVQTRWTSAVKIPDSSLTFETAASLPMAFATAYISLFDNGRLKAGERVLVHAAGGGVGQAVVMMAQNAGAEVFATVGSQAKRQLLVDKYGVPDNHIFSSRDASFGHGVLAATRGQGVDVVVNSLAGTLLQEGVNCLARFGRFVEIGKHDIEVNSDLELGSFSHSVTFTHVDLMQLQEYRGAQVQRALAEVMRMYTQGEIKAVSPVTVYPLAQLEKMMRLMQAGKHMGKLVAHVQLEGINPVNIPHLTPYLRTREQLTLHQIPAPEPRVVLDAGGSYLVVGGLGAIGQLICEWLAEHGAKHLIVLSRSARNTGSLTAQLQADMADLECQLHLHKCDITDKKELARALSDVQASLPAIRGVIHAGMVLHDSIFERMSLSDYKAALGPKVDGSWHLHDLLHDKKLDFFVMLSSLTGILGSPSQSNYTAGGSFQDALAAHRVRQGLPAVSIDLSLVDHVGYAADHGGVAERLSKLGFRVLSADNVLEAVGRAIASPWQGQLLVGIDRDPGSHWNEDATLGRDNRFALLRPTEVAESTANSAARRGEATAAKGATRCDLGTKVREASTLDAAANIVTEVICQKVKDIFALQEDDDVDVRQPLTRYGVDSLVVVEIRNMLALEAGAELSVFDVMQSPSISRLGSMVAAKSSYLDSRLIGPQ